MAMTEQCDGSWVVCGISRLRCHAAVDGSYVVGLRLPPSIPVEDLLTGSALVVPNSGGT
jgi:hypothetical protein